MGINEQPLTVPIDFYQIKKAALIIRSLNNSLRQRIYNFLLTAGNSTVSNIVASLALKQSIVSQHLAILRRAKIVSYLKKGKFVYYHINIERVSEIRHFVFKLLENNKPLLQKKG